MGEPHPIHSSDAGSIGMYASRHLEQGLLVLTDLCDNESRVLDLGCGPGSITLDVAELVPEGSVTGVDAEEVPLQRARELAAEKGIDNVSFIQADAHNLPFGDGEFDVTYANTLLEWVNDPVEVMREMMRVTKPGGSVIARNNDYDTIKLFPPLPHFEKYQRGLSYFRDSENKGSLGSRWRGRELFSIFVRAGLQEIGVSAEDIVVSWFGTELFQMACKALKHHFNPDYAMSGFAFKLVEEGILSMDDIEAIHQEIDGYQRNPEAFAIHPVWLTAVGTVLGD